LSFRCLAGFLIDRDVVTVLEKSAGQYTDGSPVATALAEALELQAWPGERFEQPWENELSSSGFISLFSQCPSNKEFAHVS
jgi:hypothetical protein